jgi:hypothetical protein
VGVPAEPVVGLEQVHIELSLQQMRGGQSGDPGADDGDGLAGWGAHLCVFFLVGGSKEIRSRRGHGLLDIPTLGVHQITAISSYRWICATRPPVRRVTSYGRNHAK